MWPSMNWRHSFAILPLETNRWCLRSFGFPASLPIATIFSRVLILHSCSGIGSIFRANTAIPQLQHRTAFAAPVATDNQRVCLKRYSVTLLNGMRKKKKKNNLLSAYYPSPLFFLASFPWCVLINVSTPLFTFNCMQRLRLPTPLRIINRKQENFPSLLPQQSATSACGFDEIFPFILFNALSTFSFGTVTVP